MPKYTAPESKMPKATLMTNKIDTMRGKPLFFSHDTNGFNKKPSKVAKAKGMSNSRPKYRPMMIKAAMLMPMNTRKLGTKLATWWMAFRSAGWMGVSNGASGAEADGVPAGAVVVVLLGSGLWAGLGIKSSLMVGFRHAG